MIRFVTPARLAVSFVVAALATSSLAGAQTAPSGLTHQYLFDEGTGAHVAHDSVGTIDGTGGADALWITGEAPALGQAHDRVVAMFPQAGLDDPTAYIDYGNALGRFGAADFTVAHDFVVLQSTPGTLSDVIGNRTSYGHGNFFAVRMRGDGILSVELDQDASGTNYIGFAAEGKPVNDSRLHHLAYVRQNATLSLYIDGVLAQSARTASGQATFINGDSPFRVGRSAPFAFTSVAAIYDDLRIYDRALTADEIKTIASGG